jgi:hypothetical protein
MQPVRLLSGKPSENQRDVRRRFLPALLFRFLHPAKPRSFRSRSLVKNGNGRLKDYVTFIRPSVCVIQPWSSLQLNACVNAPRNTTSSPPKTRATV